MRNRLVALATIVGLAAAPAAQAGHHLWDFTEAFSNADGSVQFIELFTADNNEQGVGAFTVKSGANTFNFVTNCPTSLTANTWILIATSGFASLPGGITPDYVLPFGNFFPTGGGTLNYASGADIWNYGAVPTDGYHSLLRNGSTAVNSPTNFAGAVGKINLMAAPVSSAWGIAALAGALLLAGSGLLRRREQNTA